MTKLNNLLLASVAWALIVGSIGCSKPTVASADEGQMSSASQNSGPAIDSVVTAAALASSPCPAKLNAASSDHVEGRVLGSGDAIAESTVTLWAAGEEAARKLAATQNGRRRRFRFAA